MYDLTKYNGLNLKSEASEVFSFKTEEDLIKILAHAEDKQRELQVIGSGTNTIFPRYFSKIVIKSANNNFSYTEDDSHRLLEVGAAVEWDDLINFCANKNIYGLENLAGIPGTVGAAPIQNIGAYGLEISSLINYVECFDTELKITRKIKADNCEFGYRQSLFQKNTHLIVTAVGFKLSNQFNPSLEYEGLQNLQFNKASDMIDKIREIRNTKLPDPKDFPNLGSFFKNPIIDIEAVQKNQKLIDLKKFELPNGKIKLSAGEMLENLQLKGMKLRNVGIWTHHALVLTSNGVTSAKDIRHLEDFLKTLVKKHYDVELEREPTYL